MVPTGAAVLVARRDHGDAGGKAAHRVAQVDRAHAGTRASSAARSAGAAISSHGAIAAAGSSRRGSSTNRPGVGQVGAELEQQRAQVHLDGERVRAVGGDHHRHGDHAAQRRRAEAVDERLEQAGVGRLVGGARDHGDLGVGKDRAQLLVGGGAVGEVHLDHGAGGAEVDDRAGDGQGERGGPRPRPRVAAESDAERDMPRL